MQSASESVNPALIAIFGLFCGSASDIARSGEQYNHHPVATNELDTPWRHYHFSQTRTEYFQ